MTLSLSLIFLAAEMESWNIDIDLFRSKLRKRRDITSLESVYIYIYIHMYRVIIILKISYGGHGWNQSCDGQEMREERGSTNSKLKKLFKFFHQKFQIQFKIVDHSFVVIVVHVI
jgi:dienelactone hydrolase